MSSDLTSLLERLIEAKVDFVLVGGFAGVVHGCTYVTQDIDICCDFSPANLLLLQQALSDVHPVHRMTPGRIPLQLTESDCQNLKNLYLDTDIGQLDSISFVDGVGDYRDAKDASIVVEVGGIQLRVINIDALIKAKKAMNRPRDKEAVLQLETLKNLKKE
ncbi:MAG: nucleotidyltransferase [Planctomycetota bacterium]